MSARKDATGSDLAKVDAHDIQAHEYEEIPELTAADFARGEVHMDGVPIRRGGPRSAAPKQQVTLRLDRDVVERFRATGHGWQSRMNMALRKAIGLRG